MDRNLGISRRSLSLIGIAAILGLSIAFGLGLQVRSAEGNLAWDDADYLRRGLRIANRAAEPGSGFFFRAAADLLAERPKPPMLVAWISSCARVLPKENVVDLIEASSVVPFGLLTAAVIVFSARRSGPGSATVGVLVLAASPLALTFGAKVMVETFLGLWILLTIRFASLVLDRPTRPRCLGLGASIGLAMMTKLTVALLLPAPGVAFLTLFARRFGLGRGAIRPALNILIPILLIAGPWYARNGRAAVDFARFSSRYNVVAEGRSDRTPTVDRLRSMAGEVAGWAGLSAIALGFLIRLRDGSRPADAFSILAWSGALGGGSILLVPTYFDPRFLLPIWPSIAVVAADWLSPGPDRRLARGLGWALLAVGLVASASAVARSPRSSTSWAARYLIEDLVRDRRVRSIANLGNTADWNVCKTGLVNELRSKPESCFVLHDLSGEAPTELSTRLARHDAVFLLDPPALGPEQIAGAPGLNCSYDLGGAILRGDPRFEAIRPGPKGGLPGITVFVRRR